MESRTLHLSIVVTGLHGPGILLVNFLKYVKRISCEKHGKSNGFEEDKHICAKNFELHLCI